MEPITAIVSAIVLGATAALQDTAKDVIKDGYEALKGFLKRKFSDVDVKQIEKEPSSAVRTDLLKEELVRSGAADDPDLLALAKSFIETVSKEAPQLAAAVGVDLEKLRGATISVKDVQATGTGVRGRDWEATGDVTIEGVRAGKKASDSVGSPTRRNT